MRQIGAWVGLCAVCVAPVLGIGQESGSLTPTPKPPEHFYRLSLTVEQTDDAGKVTNTRNFVATVVSAGGGTQSIRTGERVPVQTSSEHADQWQYMDLGVNFDIRDVTEVGSSLSFRLAAALSSLANPADSRSAETAIHPVIRENKWDSSVLVPVGKPTIVFSADDLQDKGKMQVELTVTRVD
jgi:hypothetical protein